MSFKITNLTCDLRNMQVGLLNVDGYYNSLLSFIDKAVDEGFVTPSARHIIISAPTAQELMSKLEDYVPKHNGVAPKLSWEMEQQLGYTTTKLEIAR
uniref:cytokinin riboside 5'-monophosphate phosphoribohydrolase n=1 Tax=Solanum chacoense TaxID=4108 RepID=A0A0V0I3Y6_SOLCH